MAGSASFNTSFISTAAASMIALPKRLSFKSKDKVTRVNQPLDLSLVRTSWRRASGFISSTLGGNSRLDSSPRLDIALPTPWCEIRATLSRGAAVVCRRPFSILSLNKF
jgi:hypothetical protein